MFILRYFLISYSHTPISGKLLTLHLFFEPKLIVMLRKIKKAGNVLFCIVFFFMSSFLSVKTVAQKSSLGMSTIQKTTQQKITKTPRKVSYTTAVDVITGDEISTYKGENITEVIRSLPNVNIDKSRSTTVELRGLGSNRSLVLLNGRRVPVYGQSVTYDLNSIPIEAIERINVINDGTAEYGADAISGVVNFITKKDMGERIGDNNTYNPYYVIPKINYNNAINDKYHQWETEVQTIYNTELGEKTIPDDTYGLGGSLRMDLHLNGDYRIQELNFMDKSGTVRQKTTYEWYPEKYRFGETFYYDCGGLKLHYDSYLNDVNGYKFEWKQKSYDKGVNIDIHRDMLLNLGGNPIRVNLTPKISLDQILPNKWDTYNFTPNQQPCDNVDYSGCDRNNFHIGVRLVLEDFGVGETLLMPGPYFEYTYNVCKKVGITGNVGINFGTKNDVKYTKFGLLGGLSYTPFNKADCDDNFKFTTQALIGLVNQSSKYMDNKSSKGYFGGLFGILGDFKLGDNSGLTLGAHYFPTFQKNNTSSNFSFNVGYRLSWGNYK